ncbi:DUF1592 domain-containing protein [Roseiconus nitratireducens]|uniref:DUF1592 domain-containing protein n=1 Tax=Roseiconus nitratireducens TaxID=2605748 RepID=A0A5M6D055_9BACT|nr:DUF1592 domain-containing protein [Roseiconus nitratireducens]KAA5540723.1 DUF1592 domain-containing protein [Roseiconus nitratireducens]
MSFGKRVQRCPFPTGVIVYLLTTLSAPQVMAEDQLVSLLSHHCFDCHDGSTTEGELNLASMVEVDGESQARIYQRVAERVAAGEMPPDDASSLSDEERRSILRHVDKRLSDLADALRDDPGRVELTRLTPYEYRNIMRDISGGVFVGAGRFLPNEGGAGEGFANVGAAQSMTLAQYEKYVDAARNTLAHVRFYPLANNNEAADSAWTTYPRSASDEPVDARQEVADEIIQWHVAQQQKWNEEHRRDLERQLGFAHPAYLESSWRYQVRESREQILSEFAWVPVDATDVDGERIELSPVALEKWFKILIGDVSNSVHRDWASAWQQLPQDPAVPLADVRTRCVEIVSGNDNVVVETEDYAPAYEISFHEAKNEVLQAAEEKGHWPFRIDIGDAEELFLIVTDAGDGGRGEYAVWRRGRFIFRDGTSRQWQDVVTIVGANSGREYPFGFDGEKTKSLRDDELGAKPPGALKFQVPEDAIVFEVDLTLDRARTETASIQALVLKQKPKSQSYVPGRFVFGGKKRPVTAAARLKKEQERALRKRNIAEANKTKIGLNAERNVFAAWQRTSLEAIGGPWPEQEADKFEADFPYHFTVHEVVRNATRDDLAELNHFQNRLEALARSHPSTGPAVSNAEEQLVRRTIKQFAESLWRRQIGDQDTERLIKLYRESRANGFSFDSSIKSSLMAVMISPDFLLRGLSRSGGDTKGNELSSVADSNGHPCRPLSTEALATRLSFFLWASIPDQELRELAATDRLRDPDVLVQQARRMLKDPRAKSLATDFAGQLWGFSDFVTFVNPDAERFKEFDEHLRASMQAEVELFLADVFQGNRPLTNLLVSDDSILDERLAKHYNLEAQYESADESAGAVERRGLSSEPSSHRVVKLTAERGGLATMGLFLTKTSLPLRTSPVQRGVWVMESLLGRHLPNPPANVPPLSEDDTNTAGESILLQLERHRADRSCASCHDKIDPLGISLEGFDAIGRTRQIEREGRPLSTVATTHDGFELRGAAGLKEYLIQNTDEFVDHFNRKLLGYALGRAVSIGDHFLLNQMKQNLIEQHYRFSSLVETIVLSPQFRTKREY